MQSINNYSLNAGFRSQVVGIDRYQPYQCLFFVFYIIRYGNGRKNARDGDYNHDLDQGKPCRVGLQVVC
jgi:hypothetical protein